MVAKRIMSVGDERVSRGEPQMSHMTLQSLAEGPATSANLSPYAISVQVIAHTPSFSRTCAYRVDVARVAGVTSAADLAGWVVGPYSYSRLVD